MLACVAGFVSVAWSGLSGLRIAAATPVLAAPVKRVLPDGSIAQLQNGASLVAEFGDQIRRVILRDGAADFHVSKDRFRPFVVRAGGVEVQAVGTAFSVSREKLTISVAVTEGRVSVAKSSTDSSRPETLALVQPGTSVAVLDFHDTPLGEAVAVVNQRAAVRLVIRDVSLAGLKISRTILADDIDSLLRHLREEFYVQAERRGNEISLRKTGTR
jgi:transmembrane sensor